MSTSDFCSTFFDGGKFVGHGPGGPSLSPVEAPDLNSNNYFSDNSFFSFSLVMSSFAIFLVKYKKTQNK